jgi:hypothetical protein
MKTKTYPNILRVLLTAFVIIATGAALTHAGDSDQPTKPNPFDSIINRVMYIDETVVFEDFYPMFAVCFTNLVNYEPVETPGCSILEVYNVTKGNTINFYPTDEVIGYDPYIPMSYAGWFFEMSAIWVYSITPAGGAWPEDGDILRIKFRIPNDVEYDSPVFELYAPYIYDPNQYGGPELYWD